MSVYRRTFVQLDPDFFHPRHVALHILLLDRLALIVGLLTLCQGYLQLGKTPVVDEQPVGHDGKAAFLDALFQLFKLTALQQQLADAPLFVVELVAVAVLGDKHGAHVQLAVLEHAVRIAQVDTALANRLDLGPLQDDAGLVSIDKLVFVPGAPVDDFYFGFLVCHDAGI